MQNTMDYHPLFSAIRKAYLSLPAEVAYSNATTFSYHKTEHVYQMNDSIHLHFVSLYHLTSIKFDYPI